MGLDGRLVLRVLSEETVEGRLGQRDVTRHANQERLRTWAISNQMHRYTHPSNILVVLISSIQHKGCLQAACQPLVANMLGSEQHLERQKYRPRSFKLMFEYELIRRVVLRVSTLDTPSK